MKFIYPAVIHRTNKGTYRAVFPDLECCEAEGETLEEAVELANEAAGNWIGLELSEDNPDLPAVTDPGDLILEKGDVVRNICVNIRFMDGWDE
ncbi:MAG: type II toxin-antitoxin system HicB family antitoxin [Lachnospiraceae bacterium]|nr:type II toxin-antitoxin system HicB family antitoxin [Lachnospiraceae bacterium]